MEQMQFTAVVLLTLLLMKLLMLPNKVVITPVAGKARWLMTVGIALLVFQFLLQYTLGLRSMGVTQSVLVNLLLFIPSSWTLSMAVIYLQRHGYISRVDKLIGAFTWGLAIVLLGTATIVDGQPLLSDTPKLHYAEVITSFFYLTMQGYYAWRHGVNLRSMRLSLQNYYDHDMDGMLMWMKFSIIILVVFALMVPFLIFVESQWLAVYGVLFFFGISYLVDSFCSYMVSSAPKKIREAELSEDVITKDERKKNMATSATKGRMDKNSPDTELQTEDMAKEHSRCSSVADEVDPGASLSAAHSALIQKWIEKGGYRRNGITMPIAAEEIGVPRYFLTVWLRKNNFTYTAWITTLRIEEAKRVMKEHPKWTNEAVAQYCGFSDRSYFQKKFKEQIGVSPSEYQLS